MRAVRRPLTACGRCLARRPFSTSATICQSASPSSPPPTTSQVPPPPPLAGHTHLTTRALISLAGPDASRFLQGLTTAHIPPAASQPPAPPPSGSGSRPQPAAIYSAFLNAQGRILHDVFIYPTTHVPLLSGILTSHTAEESYLIEVDAAEQDQLLRWLKRYKLRSKISLRAVSADECGVIGAWGDSAPADPQPREAAEAVRYPDLRAPGLGQRILLPSPAGSSRPLSARLGVEEGSVLASMAQYTLRRYLHGVAEGQVELQRETALVQESGLDYMGGVDFRKGCYVGQELVIRTQHTGVVRKRVVPVVVYEGREGEEQGRVPEKLEYSEEDGRAFEGVLGKVRVGDDIVRGEGKGRRVARWMGGVGNVGLALWRLENVEGEFRFKVAEGEEQERELRLKPFLPEWWEQRKKGTGSV